MKTSNYLKYLNNVLSDVKDIFSFDDLNIDLFNKVVFIYLNHSSGLGGYGSLHMFTKDNESYYLPFECLAKKYNNKDINEYNLAKYIPLLKGKLIKEENYYFKYDLEDNGWTKIKKAIIRNDYYEKIKDKYEQIKDNKYFHPLDLLEIPYDNNKPSINKVYEPYKKYLLDEIQKEKKNIADKLTSKDVVWKKYSHKKDLENDYDGIYCLLFKKDNNQIEGYRWIIDFQYHNNEIKYSLDRKTGTTKRISKPESYNLYLKEYDHIAGNLAYPIEDNEEYITFSNKNLDYDKGRFIASYKTLNKAKQAVLDYSKVYKSNRIFDYPNLKMKYQSIVDYYKPLLIYVENYEKIKTIINNFDPLKDRLSLVSHLAKQLDISYYDAERIIDYFKEKIRSEKVHEAKEIVAKYEKLIANESE